MADIFKLYSKYVLTLQTRNHEVNRQIFLCARFSLEWQSNYVVEELSADRQRAIM